MYFLEINDILFLVKSLKTPSMAFNINHYVTFNRSATRSGSFDKLIPNYTSSSHTRHFYFNRITRLWNSLPHINLDQSIDTIKSNLYNYLWDHFITNFNPNNAHTFHYICPCNQCSHLPYRTVFHNLN